MLEEVSKEQFHQILGSQDLVVATDGSCDGTKYPYNAYYKTHSGTIKGIIKPVLNEYGREKYPIEHVYFINK